MSLAHLDIDELAVLAEKHDVKIDKRWKRDRIEQTIADAGITIPADTAGDDLTDLVDNEPVVFVGSIGSIRPKNRTYDVQPDGSKVEVPGLIVYFKNADGEPVGGFSRQFYPDLPDAGEGEEDDSAVSLALVRDYLKNTKIGRELAVQWKIREAKVNEPTEPINGWHGVHHSGIAQLYKLAPFDLKNAVRYEKANGNRSEVLSELNRLHKSDDVVADADITTAVITL